MMVGRVGRVGRVKGAVRWAMRRKRGRPETETVTETATESAGSAGRRNGCRRRSGFYGKGGEEQMQGKQMKSKHTNLRISGYT
jgi:hypothetical protein